MCCESCERSGVAADERVHTAKGFSVQPLPLCRESEVALVRVASGNKQNSDHWSKQLDRIKKGS